MITRLSDRGYYEDLYDRHTVEIGRREANILLGARAKFYEKAKDIDKKGADLMDFWWERLYWWFVEIPTLLPRWEERERTIDSWAAQDRALDERLANARPHIEPVCSHCGSEGLRLVNKQLLRRDSSEQIVLFMFACPACKKRSAYWEDGIEWESPVSPCPECSENMTMDVTHKGKALIATFTCPTCEHTEVETMKLGEKDKEVPDPYYERDKKLFCLTNERAHTMQEYRIKWQAVQRLIDEEMEKDKKRDVYNVVAQLQTLRVIDLIEILQPVIESAGFTELRFEKPNMGREFSVEFSCLDKKSSRTDAQSRAALKKVIVNTLKPTNWRLMSDDISYRLGYLSGRVRAYEREEELAALVEREESKAARKAGSGQ